MEMVPIVLDEVCHDPMQLCAVEKESQRSCYPELEHTSAVKRDHRGLLLGPAGRCQSAVINQRSLFRVRPYILLMSLRRVRGPTGRCQSAEVDQRSLSRVAALLLMSKRRVRGSLSRVH